VCKRPPTRRLDFLMVAVRSLFWVTGDRGAIGKELLDGSSSEAGFQVERQEHRQDGIVVTFRGFV
jgi:hypothetical protein